MHCPSMLLKGDNVHITIITMLGTVSYFNLILRREIKSAPAPNPNQDTRIYKTYLGAFDGTSQYLGDPVRRHFPGFAMPFRTATWPPSSSLGYGEIRQIVQDIAVEGCSDPNTSSSIASDR